MVAVDAELAWEALREGRLEAFLLELLSLESLLAPVPLVVAGELPEEVSLPVLPREEAARRALLVVAHRPDPYLESPARLLLFPKRKGWPSLARLFDLLALFPYKAA